VGSLCLACVAVVGGCQPTKQRHAPAGGAIELRLAGAEELAAAIHRHRGQVVLVDFWATFCLPCVELFPHTVELAERWQHQGLVVISVSLDDPTEQDAVRQFLERHRARFENYIGRYGTGSEGFEKFAINGLPTYKLYDRQGVLRHSFGGDTRPVVAEELDRAVAELLSALH
jgi:thiol-disulfide isomerase/thioredoxin